MIRYAGIVVRADIQVRIVRSKRKGKKPDYELQRDIELAVKAAIIVLISVREMPGLVADSMDSLHIQVRLYWQQTTETRQMISQYGQWTPELPIICAMIRDYF
jgi:hypothetical protein